MPPAFLWQCGPRKGLLSSGVSSLQGGPTVTFPKAGPRFLASVLDPFERPSPLETLRHELPPTND
eukprot:7324206-Pyramimonas_sp.AAC.1